jgi:RNA polymerase sigma factor for flagellar operon FliA
MSTIGHGRLCEWFALLGDRSNVPVSPSPGWFRSATVLGMGTATAVATELDVDALVRDNMAVVGHIVRETMSKMPTHVSRDDLTSAGLLALVQVARNYDASRGVPLAKFAAHRIRGAILDELRGMDWASRSVRRRQRSLDEVRSRLAVDLGRVPSNAEIAEALGISVAELSSHDDDVNRASVMSLQGFGENTLDDLLPTREPDPAQAVEHKERLGYMRDAVELLPERLRVVVEQYFLAERPMAEIAEQLGVTESRVSQMRAEALVLMREAMAKALDGSQDAKPANGCAARRKESYYAAVASHRTFAARLGDVPAAAAARTA